MPFTATEKKEWTEEKVKAFSEYVERQRPKQLAKQIEVRIESLTNPDTFKSLGEKGRPLDAIRRWFDSKAYPEAASIYMAFPDVLRPLPKIERKLGIQLVLGELLCWCSESHGILVGRCKLRAKMLRISSTTARRMALYLLDNPYTIGKAIADVLGLTENNVRQTYLRHLKTLGFRNDENMGGYYHCSNKNSR